MTGRPVGMEMMVRIVVSPERVPLVLDRLGEVVEQTRGEDGCTEDVVYTTDQPGELWLKGAYISQEYHDSGHEEKAEEGLPRLDRSRGDAGRDGRAADART